MFYVILRLDYQIRNPKRVTRHELRVTISLGSVSEIETQLEIAKRLGYIKSREQEQVILDRIRQMLIGLIRSVTRNA